jgi:hypothetical protein
MINVAKNFALNRYFQYPTYRMNRLVAEAVPRAKTVACFRSHMHQRNHSTFIDVAPASGCCAATDQQR